jgi:glycosyltransferase involved in cell wall biosynthesis
MRVSVIIDNYNYATYLQQAVESALAQLEDGDELIVVDDGSTDGSAALMQRWAGEPRVRLLLRDNGGQLAAVNTGVAAADGDLVAILDADDYFLPGHLQRARAVFEEQPAVAYLFADASYFAADDVDTTAIAATHERMRFQPGLQGPTRWAALGFGEFISLPTSGIVMRRELALRIAELEPLLRGVTAGRWFWPASEGRYLHFSYDGVAARAASALGAQKYFLAQPGFAYRIHGSNRYAAHGALGRKRVNLGRIRAITAAIREGFGLAQRPPVEELRLEFCARRWPVHRRRCWHLKLNYLRLALRSGGALAARLGLALRIVLSLPQAQAQEATAGSQRRRQQ